MLGDFVKLTLTRVSSHWLWLESSQSVKNVTRIESSHDRFSTWLESRCHWCRAAQPTAVRFRYNWCCCEHL